ncbi:DUF2092 domain-containing protein [Caballeronia sp. DA-9]|uniref:DUF2092 domain-containing protein n=1 Tax=Caballeronia sp. DA-9 TaxID=3436237 RepID=UPI003F66E9DD
MPSRKPQTARAALAVACAAACVAYGVSVTNAIAQSSPTPASSTAATAQPERQQKALDALGAMSQYLRSLNRFDVTASTSTDAVLDSGQTLAFLHETDLKVERPNRMRADVTGSRAPKGLIYDGRHFTIFNTAEGYYSTNPAPPSNDLLVRELSTTYNIDTPLADLFYWGNGKVDDVTLTSALFLGLERVDTRWCNHYAYQQSGADWEIWIQSGSRPLPCRMAIVDTSQSARPRHVATYHWKINPEFPASTFTFRPAANAKAIELKPASRTPFEGSE